MKISLLTIWHERNYGAEMQAYATIRALKELGHEVEMIYLLLSSINHRSLKGRIAYIFEKLSPAEQNFKLFWKKFIPCTRRYSSLEELKRNPPVSDCYVVGSDQVWNPEIVKSLTPVYFLNFGGNNIRRVSYASSFGINKWCFSEVLTKEIKKYLSAFDAISCREQTGCDILKKVFGVDSVNVVDPTLLHSEYTELIGNPTEQNTLAFYPLNPELELTLYSQQLASRLSLQWINANEQKRILKDKVVWERNSIELWIESIATAQFVVTCSFHGLAFSIIHRRQFIIINNTNRSSRITDLLTRLGLMDRFFASIEEVERNKPWERQIDYTLVNKKLQKMREASWNFLKENLR